MDFNEIINHLGEDRSKYFNAVAPPIIQSSNFVFDSLEELREKLADEANQHIYTRGNNPTVEILRKKVAALEGAEDALVFSSGSAAIAAAVISNVQAGDHIISVEKPYGWTNSLLSRFLTRFGVTTTFVDARDVENIVQAIQPNTRLLYLESPNSLTFELQDLEGCAALAKQHQIITVIDNSYASPLYQNPIAWGIDIVIHSATKYLNGHSDAVGGVVCGGRKYIQRLFSNEYMILGGVISPHDAALMIRGLRTLEIRMQRTNESAMQVVAFLEKHPKVKDVLYPFSPAFAQYELARKQMKGAGGLFSIHLDIEHLEQADAFFNRLNRFAMAVSWGGHESLVMPSAVFYNITGRANSTLPFTLFRFYVGLEDPNWLIEDLAQALDGI